MEYLIRVAEGDCFDIGALGERLEAVLTPAGLGATPISGWGDFRLAFGDAEVAFSWEMPGWQVSMEGTLPPQETADELVALIARQIQAETGIPTIWFQI